MTAAADRVASFATALSSTAHTSAAVALGPMSPRSPKVASRTTRMGIRRAASDSSTAATLSVVRPFADRDLRAYLDSGPLFCFTTDIEWAPDWAIEATFALADRHRVTLTPFITHRSDFLQKRLGPDLAGAGIHPNFLPGSTHGANVDEVVARMAALVPNARAFRSHCFYDETRMQRKLAERHFTHDSNACAFLQPSLVPMRTVTTILRFPVFWEDDLHSGFGLPWTLDALRPALDSPGLKIVNVHPLRVALNVADESWYASVRERYEPLTSGAGEPHSGPGTRTLLEELFRHATSGGRRTLSLDELYRHAVERGIALTRS